MIIPPIRAVDKWGSGAYKASRGSRVHNGVDLACYQGSQICSLTHGVISKIGYPYPPSNPDKGHLRYVEVDLDGNRFRYFYISPSVEVGDRVEPGTVIGVSQGLLDIYPGITDHIHLELITPDGSFVDPEQFL